MKTRLSIQALIVFALAASSTQAAILSYDFTVTATSGPLENVSSSGSFSFDQSIIPANIPSGGVIVPGPGLLSDLSFSWNGIAYDESTANTGAFIFYPDGFVTCFGNNASAYGCGAGALSNDWYVSLYQNGSGEFVYATPDSSWLGWGTVSYQLSANVPEPNILGLVTLGLTALALSCRRKII